MKIISYTVEGLGSTPIREQAINAAKVRAKETGKPVPVVATLDNGKTREVIYHPDGFIQRIWMIAQSTPLSPEEGRIYRNAGGGLFRCERVYDTKARMVNIASGWEFIAHGCRSYFDGSIEWDYSTDGRFVEGWNK